MRSGDLRSRVGFYKRASSSGDSPDYGVPEGEFPGEPEFSCAAKIEPKLGGESVLAGRLTGTNLVNVTVRRSSSTQLIDTAWMLKDSRSGVSYNIRSIIDPHEGGIEHGRWLEMLCEKGGAS